MTLRRAAPLRSALLWLCLALFAAPALQAQESGGAAEAAGQAAAGAEADALIRLLENPEARQALIDRLRQGAGEGGGQGEETGGGSASGEGAGDASAQGEAASGGGETAAEQAVDAARTTGAAAESAAETAAQAPEAAASLGRRAAEFTQGIAENVAGLAIMAGEALINAPQRLSGLENAADPEVLLTAARELGLAILVTYAVFLSLRFAARPLRTRLAGAGVEAGFLRTALLSFGVTALDAVIVLVAWAAGYAIVTLLLGDAASLGLRQTLYLNAFVAVEMARIAIRLLLRPESGRLRLIHIPDGGARYLSARLSLAAALLGYGQLLAVPIVNAEAGWRAGQALGAAVSMLVVLIGIVAVLRHRRPVAAWLTPQEPESRRVFAALARLWHIPLLAYLVFLFFLVLIRPGDVLWPVLEASGKIAIAVILGMMVNTLLARRARQGVRLPGRVTSSLPLLERRVNGFVPKALLVLRLLVAAAVTAAALDIVGLWDLDAWMASELGLRLTGGLVSVALILLGAFILWVAFASWIDWRLNPEVGKVPTSRETTLLSLLRNAGAIALLVVTLMFALSELGIDIAPLLASAGVLGLAIGFGAQKLVQDVITGVFIQLENAMNVEDVVTVNGTTGTVEKLTIRSVSLRDLHGAYHLIPFSSVDMVTNYMREFAYCVTDMGIAYREDVEEARQAMADAFQELRADPDIGPLILDDLEWFGLNAFGDSAVVLRARIKTLPGKQWGVGRAYNAHLKTVFDARGIEIPFPHQTIYFGEDKRGAAPPLHLVRDDREGGPRTEDARSPQDDDGDAGRGDDVRPREDMPESDEV